MNDGASSVTPLTRTHPRSARFNAVIISGTSRDLPLASQGTLGAAWTKDYKGAARCKGTLLTFPWLGLFFFFLARCATRLDTSYSMPTSLFLSPTDIICNDMDYFKHFLKNLIFLMRMLWRGRTSTFPSGLVFLHQKHCLAYGCMCSLVLTLHTTSEILLFIKYFAFLDSSPLLYTSTHLFLLIFHLFPFLFVVFLYALYSCTQCFTREGPALLVST